MSDAPQERFKGAYNNHRFNVFTEEDLAVDKTEDNLYIPGGSPFLIQLLEVPRKNDPTSVTVYCYDDEANFAEVLTSPAQSEFRVDYPPEDGDGTGLIEFNQNDAGKEVKIEYKATGSPMLSEFLDTKVSWPDGNPAENQIVAFEGTPKVPIWRNNPVCYFHDDNVIYHSAAEIWSCMLFRFKRSAYQSKVFLELKGANLHQGYYTELMEHNHAKGTLAGTQPTHTHGKGTLVTDTVPKHSHSFSGTAASAGAHSHNMHYYGANVGQGMWRDDNTDSGGAHTHGVSGTTGDAGNHDHSISGSTASGGGDAVTISGSTANTGVTPKTYPSDLKVYINGVDKTAQVLAKTGLTEFGDGTGSHAFVTTGSGEMDISDLITSAGIHEIKITEPTSAKGGRCLLHLEVY